MVPEQNAFSLVGIDHDGYNEIRAAGRMMNRFANAATFRTKALPRGAVRIIPYDIEPSTPQVESYAEPHRSKSNNCHTPGPAHTSPVS
jgi:hypothetical protein